MTRTHAIIGINAVWALDSIIGLAGGWLEANALGTTVIVGQAIAVAVIAQMEFIGLRRMSRLTAPAT